MSNTLYIDEIEVGLSKTRSKRVSREDISAFGAVSGDMNPVHFCNDYASSTPFGGVIAHGMLSAALISAVIGEELPGHGAIYLGQTLKFHAPVRPGDLVTATCTVVDKIDEKRRLTLECVCEVDGKTVLSGEAVVMAPKREMAIAAG